MLFSARFRTAVRVVTVLTGCALVSLTGCKNDPPAAAAGGGMQAMPVAVEIASLSSVPNADTYVATIKSLRSAVLQPQVEGNLTKIFVKSGDMVRAGQVLMQIDPLKQVATVQAQQGSEQQQKAAFDYNQADLQRQEQLFKAGIISRQAYDQALQSFQNSKAALEAASAQVRTQREQLAYYQIRAPFAGIVGDIPVHIGDYISSQTTLTTVDENKGLEAYIYVPTDRAAQVKTGLPVDLLDANGTVLAHSSLYFVSPQVDNSLQGILAKAPIPKSAVMLRNGQILNARITWNSAPAITIPVLAVTRIGGQSFVYVAKPQANGFLAHQTAISLGEPVGNRYPVRSGLNDGDRVITSGTQLLQEGFPVMPMTPQGGGAPQKPASAH